MEIGRLLETDAGAIARRIGDARPIIRMEIGQRITREVGRMDVSTAEERDISNPDKQPKDGRMVCKGR